MIHKSKNSCKAFTITELLIVIALISILMIAGLIAYRSQVGKSYDAIRKRDLNNLKIAFEHYYSDHGCYPPLSILDNCGGAQLQPYIDEIPCDPQTGAKYTLKLDTNVGCAQKYYVSTDLVVDTDPQINCNGKFMVHSPNVTQNDIGIFCKQGGPLCDFGYYGCISGACTLISGDTKPACEPWFCASNCNNGCTIDQNRDGIYDRELTPQPCNP